MTRISTPKLNPSHTRSLVKIGSPALAVAPEQCKPVSEASPLENRPEKDRSIPSQQVEACRIQIEAERHIIDESISMATLKADVMIQDATYEQLAAIAHKLQISHSELLVLAIEDYLQRYHRQALQENWNEAYADDLDEDEQMTLERMRHHQRQLAGLALIAEPQEP
jgi:hypothetical protein